jgi:hypothetical protein
MADVGRFSVRRFLIRLLVLYALLVIPWPGVRTAYLTAFRGVGNLLRDHVHPSVSVSFVQPGEGDEGIAGRRDWNTDIRVVRRATGASGVMSYETQHGYLATALTIALVLATPLPRRRKLTAMAWALVLISLFVAARVYLGILFILCSGQPVAPFHPAPGLQKLLVLSVQALLGSPESTFIVPVFVWCIAAVRGRDVAAWLAAARSHKERHEARSLLSRPRGHD